jgi:uncharacterized protein (TIGR03437 family)
MNALRPDRGGAASLSLDDSGRQSIRAGSGYRSGLLAVLLAAAAAMLPGQIVHPLAQPRYDQGPVDASLRLGYIQMMFQQTPAQSEALDQLLAAQRDPASPNYHNWLTPEQYADRFGLSVTDLARVAGWLKSAGFTIEYTARGRDWIAFSGTAGQVQAAFQTSVHRYAVGSETHFAVATEPAIPSELTPFVATIFGLNDFYPKSMLKPAFTSASGVLASPSLAPGDLATIYDINPLYQQGVDGTGQKIVIVGQYAVELSDIQQFRSNYGLGAATIKLVQNGTPGVNPGDQIEADLDLEWAGAIAPNATLIYVYGADAGSAALYAIDQNLAPVVSMSFGLCEAYIQLSAPPQYEAEAKKGNALGITWIAASGDQGAAACDYGATVAVSGLAVSFPASVPEITAVGGTEYQEGNGNDWNSVNGTHGGSARGYIPEMAWNDTIAWNVFETGPSLAATGGGVSGLYPKPSWQVGPGVPADGQRDVPDIALAASDLHDPYNIVTSGQTIQVGGTSASTPVFAGMLALLNQSLKQNGSGNINASLYGLALNSPSMFHDIVNNGNIVPCESGTPDCENGNLGFDAGIGYDLTTGLGSVDTYNLVTGWSAATAGGATPVISSVKNAASYAAGIVSPGEMVVISGTGLGPAQLGRLAMTGSGFVSTQYSTNALISVQFNGFAAPLVYASSTATAVMVPYEVAGSTAQVTVTYLGRTSAPVTVNIAAAVPGIFTSDVSGGGQAAAFNSDGRTLNSSATPAAQGSTIILYGTGEGQTSPGGVDGKLAAAPLPIPILPVSVTIGGVQAVVQYAGAAYGEVAGMLQINVVVPPAVSGSAVSVVVQVGNAVSQAGVTIAVAASPAFAITSQEIVGAVVTNSNGALTCSAPPSKSSFLTTDPMVWVYFTFGGAQDGDVIVANWLHPSGQVDGSQPSLTLSYSGSGCAAAPLTISGTEVAQDPGNWQVKVFRNGTFQLALPFTIGP